jgi:hypothetical protein
MSTSGKMNDCNKRTDFLGRGIVEKPGKYTLNFIMQFARSYHVEEKLPAELSGLVLS